VNYLIHNQSILELLTFLSALITFVTIFPTAINLMWSRQGNRQMKNIINSLTTRFEGDFPHYLPKIAEVIPRAKRRLLILGVIPTHGAYTKTDAWLKIQDALEDKMKEQERLQRNCEGKIFTAILVYASERARENNYNKSFSKFIADENEWQDWKKNRVNRQQLGRYLEHATRGNRIQTTDIESLSIPELRKIRLDHDERSLVDVYEHFDKHVKDEIFPLFCWITDDEAVFSFKTEDPDGHYNGGGIYTRDPKLIETLVATFESFRTKAS
jgi:hypothetical protein